MTTRLSPESELMDIRLLLVGKGLELMRTVRAALPTKRCRLETMPQLEQAPLELQRGGVNLALIHVGGPDDEDRAILLLRELAAGQFAVPVIVLAESDDSDLRGRLLEAGAVDCLPHPWRISRLAFLIDLLTVRQRYEPGDGAAQPLAVPATLRRVDGFLLASPVMSRLSEQFAAVAPLSTTILLTGETGTGKSHAAQVIHQLSPRRDKPFVVVACGGLSPTLLESELFGHVRGAFTGADRSHAGKFSLAEDGTILLDEVDCMPLEAQAKLLRVSEHRVFEALGSNKSSPFRGRMIVATNQPLQREVAAGRFRADLFHRLNVVAFDVPPLRRRREAIRPLADEFLGRFCEAAGRTITGFTAEAVNALETHDWPGNIRELRNAMERAVALCGHCRIELEDLPDEVRGAATSDAADPPNEDNDLEPPLMTARKHGEWLRIQEALEHQDNNRTKAAVELRISRTALYNKLREHRCRVPGSR